MSPPAPAAAARARPGVVVADACAHARRQVRDILLRVGLRQIYEAKDGAEAVALFEAVSPDLLVLDWDLAVIPAADLIPLARGSGELKEPRVVLTMARPVREEVERALRVGATSIVAKPFSENTLRSRLRETET